MIKRLLYISNLFRYIILRFALKANTPQRLIRFAMKRNANEPFLKTGGKWLTFSEINQRIESIIQFLYSQNLTKGNLVCVRLKNCPEYFEIRLACYIAGFRFCAFIDDWDFLQCKRFLDKNKFGAFIYDNRTLQCELNTLRDNVNNVLFIRLNGEKCNNEYYYSDLLKFNTHFKNHETAHLDEIAAIGFTSGTTGVSKGVVWTNKAWMSSFYHYLINSDNTTDKPITFLHIMPFSTMGSLIILPATVMGAKSFILEEFKPETTAEAIEKEQISNLIISPDFLILLIDWLKSNKTPPNISSLKRINIGSSPVTQAKINEMLDFFGNIIWQGYGMAESLAPIALHKPTKRDTHSIVGKTVPQVKVRLNNMVTTNTGNICIKNNANSLGYIIDGKIHEHKMINNYFLSSDIGHKSDKGVLTIKGRKYDKAFYGIYKVWPRELEEIIETVTLVQKSFVLPGMSEIEIYIVPRNLQITELKQSILELLPRNHKYTFYFLERFPYSSSGKLLSGRLLSHKIPRYNDSQ